MLHKVDRASMAASLEVRVPYLDNTVIDFALNLPFSSKSNPRHSFKAVLIELLHKLAPHYNIDRPKKGFNFPIDHWLRKEWRSLTLSLVNAREIDDLGLNGNWFMGIINRYYNGEKNLCIPVWYILNLVLWKKKFETITNRTA